VLLLLPTVAVEAGGRAAWMVAVVAGVAGWVNLLVVGKLAQRFPQQTVAGYAGAILGKWPGKLVALLLAVNFGLNSSVDLSVALKDLQGIFYTNTPPWVVALILACMALAATWFGLVTASRMAPLLLTILFLTFVFTLPLLWRWLKPGYLIPLFDPSPIDIYSKPFWVATGIIRASLFPVVFMPYIKEPQKAIRTLSWAHWVGWLGNFAAVVTPVMVFGPVGAAAISQPFPYVISVIRLSVFPFERVEMLGRLAFHINTVYAIAGIYFTGGLIMAEVFGTTRIRPFMLVMVLLSLAPIVLLQSTISATEFAYGSVIRGLVASWTVFPLLWIVYWLRGGVRAHSAGA
jgi:spore germination protein KB